MPSPVRVGAFEEKTYSALAARHNFNNGNNGRKKRDEDWAEEATRELSESAEPLLQACLASLEEAKTWLGKAQTGLIGAFFSKHPHEVDKEEQKCGGGVRKKRKELEDALKAFREDKRLVVSVRL
jgi:hypothetical protein